MTSETRVSLTEINGALVQFAARKKLDFVPKSIGVLWHDKLALSISYLTLRQ